jgi:hypothetical protein
MIWMILSHYWQYILAALGALYLGFSAKYHKNKADRLAKENDGLTRQVQSLDVQQAFNEDQEEKTQVFIKTQDRDIEKLRDSFDDPNADAKLRETDPQKFVDTLTRSRKPSGSRSD